ncbi:hypothetical protein E2C01_066408 [Portunus trituberculatus]|uniref:Uncharacterized protein n=1 Tax=Portunus trituberculatus TaxID=210409 RepID=A0A5B7HUL1_PORTR|nr:hypothetical protein [Portunus trituberculatus]
MLGHRTGNTNNDGLHCAHNEAFHMAPNTPLQTQHNMKRFHYAPRAAWCRQPPTRLPQGDASEGCGGDGRYVPPPDTYVHAEIH